MITIYAEKPDMGTKIAAALDKIQLDSGKIVEFDDIENNLNDIKKQRTRDGFFKINYHGKLAFVTWGYGHMCSLKQASDYNPDWKNWKNLPLPYIPQNYELKLSTGYNNQYYNVLKKLFFTSSEIICATDNDREGDLIFDYLITYMGCKTPYKRAIFNKQSKSEFQKAFSPDNLVPSKKRIPVIQAGRARSAGDFVVGAGPTAALTLKYPGNGILSVGRVQTATLNLVVERENEIKNFVPQPFWNIIGDFDKNGSKYEGLYNVNQIKDYNKAKTLFDKLLKVKTAKITDIKQTKKTITKPYLYSLQSLQMEANKKYGFSLNDTLNIAQSLYDKGFTTYPRTDSSYLTNDMVPEMQNVLTALSKSKWSSLFKNAHAPTTLTEDNHYFDSNKVESHYAIVPTQKIATSLSGKEEKIYELIVKSVVCMLYDEAEISVTQIITTAENEEFITKGKIVSKAGFYEVIGIPKDSNLPSLNIGDIVTASFHMDKKMTQPPKRYTDATLLNAMMTCGKNIEDKELHKLMVGGIDGKPRGLGRPSSQAGIVQTLLDRQYIKKSNKNISPTQKGTILINVLPVEELKSAEMTARWEKRLDDIENGKDSYDRFMFDLENSVKQWTDKIITSKTKEGFILNTRDTSYICPVCGQPIEKLDWGYSCTGYKKHTCSFAIGNSIAGAILSDKDIDNLFNGQKTNLIHNFKSKKGKSFDAYLQLNPETHKLEFSFPEKEDKDIGMKCPLCNSNMHEVSWGYGCTNYPECRFSFGTVGNKKLTFNQAKKLLNGEAVHLKGLQSKSGKNFEADVVMEIKDNKPHYTYNFG